MTKEELQALVAGQVEGQLKAQGQVMSDSIKEQIESSVKSVLSDKIKIKEFLADDPEFQNKGEDPKAGFKSFADFAMSVRSAGKAATTGSAIDKRLIDMEQKTAGSSVREADGEYGGYLVPTEFRNQLLEVTIKKSNIMNLAFMIPMATNAVNIPYVSGMDRSSGTLHGGVTFSWLDEEGTKTESRPKFGKVELRLKKLAGLLYASDEILQDSPITMEPLLTKMFGDALAWTLDNNFINGTGAGRPLGVINAPCLIQVAKETGQDADTILYENIIKMYSRMWDKTNAVFFANDNTFPQLSTMSIAIGTAGAPVWLPAGGASGKPFDTLMGKPLFWTEHCPKLGDKGDILFCDWSQYLVGQKSGQTGMQFASSIHLKFDYDQTAFRFVFRVDGQPWWPQALVPRYATTDTLSPFLSIAERA